MEVDAVRWTGANWDEIETLCTPSATVRRQRIGGREMLAVRTLEGVMQCGPGDWLIKGVKGEMYPCRDDIFRETYEEVAVVG